MLMRELHANEVERAGPGACVGYIYMKLTTEPEERLGSREIELQEVVSYSAWVGSRNLTQGLLITESHLQLHS